MFILAKPQNADISDSTTANSLMTHLRGLAMAFDKLGIWLMTLIYQVFLSVANFDFLDGPFLAKFYRNFQLIVGVFMTFQLAVNIIQYIMNPDRINDKNVGASKVVSRIIVSLVIFSLITPLGTGGSTELEQKISSNGILFGFLYELQDNILKTNTIEKLILDSNESATTQSGNQTSNSTFKESAHTLSRIIMRGFLTHNLSDPEKADEESNWVCPAQIKKVDSYYTSGNYSAGTIMELVGKEKCNTTHWIGGNRFAYAYKPLMIGLVCIGLAVIFAGFCIDIAIRVIKLAILRLIAPIPIISHMGFSSKEAKGQDAFSLWTQALISTYLDLFLRLAVVFFVLKLISLMNVRTMFNNLKTPLDFITYLIIIIALFIFARMAPKYIRDVLGIQGTGTNIGLSAIMAGAAGFAGGRGLSGRLSGMATGMMTGVDSQVNGYNAGKAVPVNAAAQQVADTMAKIRTGDKDARGGIRGRILDRLDDTARESATRRFGIDRYDLADAKLHKKDAEKRAGETQRVLDLMNAARQSGSNQYTDADGTVHSFTDADYTKAYEANVKAQGDYTAASKKVERMEKDRGLMGANPRVADTRIVHTHRYRAARQRAIAAGTVDEFDEAYETRLDNRIRTALDDRVPVVARHITDEEGNDTGRVRYAADQNSDGRRDDEQPFGH